MGFLASAMAAMICLVGAMVCYIYEHFPTAANGAWLLPHQWPAAMLWTSLFCVFFGLFVGSLCIIVTGLVLMLGCDCTLKEVVTNKTGGLPKIPSMLGPNGASAHC